MSISSMAASLLINGFTQHDFTGWPMFTPYDDGTSCTMLTLSTDNDDDNVYSVVVNKRGDEYNFVLNVDHAVPGMGQSYNMLIRNANVIETRGSSKLGIVIGHGQSIVLDIVNRPAMASVPKEDPFEPVEEEPEEESEEDEPEEDEPEEEDPEEEEDEPEVEDVPMTRKERRQAKKQLKKKRKELIKKAKLSRPPRGKMVFSKHGRQ